MNCKQFSVFICRFIFSDGICTARNLIVFTAGTCSIFSYLTMAVQRFLAIVFNKTHLKVMIMLLLVVSFVIGVVSNDGSDDDGDDDGW